MDNEVSFEKFFHKEMFQVWLTLFLISLVVIIIGVTAFIQLKNITAEIKELTSVIELQDQEILELHGKNAQLKQEIESLEIFDCTFKKFPTLREHYYNQTIEKGLNDD